MTPLHRPLAAPLAALVTAALLLLTGCGTGQATTDSGPGTDRVLTVLAAASLTETFEELAAAFERRQDGVTVRLTFDSSAALAQQAAEGAPADVLATADAFTMDDAVEAGATADDPTVFAENTLTLVTPPHNPGAVGGLDDLSGSDWVMCVVTAPCGRLTTSLLEDNGVPAEPASFEVDVKAVLAKVTTDEADAGLVFATDAVAAGDEVRSLIVPAAVAHPVSYHVAPLRQSRDATLARAWVDLLVSEEGRRILAAAGFEVDR